MQSVSEEGEVVPVNQLRCSFFQFVNCLSWNHSKVGGRLLFLNVCLQHDNILSWLKPNIMVNKNRRLPFVWSYNLPAKLRAEVHFERKRNGFLFVLFRHCKLQFTIVSLLSKFNIQHRVLMSCSVLEVGTRSPESSNLCKYNHCVWFFVAQCTCDVFDAVLKW